MNKSFWFIMVGKYILFNEVGNMRKINIFVINAYIIVP